MNIEETINQLTIMLNCRKRQKEEFEACINCNKDITALEEAIKILEKQRNK